jgi:hypothetical protein
LDAITTRKAKETNLPEEKTQRRQFSKTLDNFRHCDQSQRDAIAKNRTARRNTASVATQV